MRGPHNAFSAFGLFSATRPTLQNCMSDSKHKLVIMLAVMSDDNCLSSVPRRSVLMCCQVEVERALVERMEEELSNLVETSLVAWESDILVTLGKPYFFTATVVRSGRQGLQISRGQGVHNRAGIYTSRGQGIHNSVGIYADAKEYRSQLLQLTAPKPLLCLASCSGSSQEIFEEC